ncbi:MAG: hypothetical protein ACR2OC_00440 [Solirubrobacterales bacterium]
MRIRTAIAILTTGLSLAGLSACGEKSEPEPALPTPSPQTTEFDLAGTWEGELRQKGLKPFEVRAVIRSPKDSRPTTVYYTGIECSGKWTVIDDVGQSVEFLETIDRGQGGECEGTGRVVVTLEAGDDRLDYVFRGGGVVSRGVLDRVS